jgi:PAP2 superfamily C-terminal
LPLTAVLIQYSKIVSFKSTNCLMNDILTKTQPQKMQESYTPTIKKRWQVALDTNGFTIKLLVAITIFIIDGIQLPSYFSHIQRREGIILSDFVLNWLPASDVSTPIFAIIYGTLVYMLSKILTKPQTFLLFIHTFAIETLFRMCTIYLFPLNPPTNLVILHDTFAELAIYGNTEPITKDLFFSGHTATMVMILLFLEKPWEKVITTLVALVLVILLLVQHVHYTIDVFGAIFFTGLSYLIARYLIQLRWQITCGIMFLFSIILQSIFILADKII